MTEENDKTRRFSRRSFIAGATTGAAAGITAREALAQEFISLGSLDDLPPNWWEIGTGPVEPVDPPVEPPVDPVDCCVPDTGGGGEDPFPPTPGVAVRRNIFSLASNGPEIASLRRGVEVMKSRSDNDPRSWNYQARIHGIRQGVDTPPFGAPWATCRHGRDDFLSWHRMYLWFFERILREASGDPALALPYWDYAVPGQNVMPVAFRERPGLPNPLFEARRNANINAGGTISSIVTDSTRAMEQTRFPRPAFSAALENQPHNIMHVEVGGAMGRASTAGEDPIFWLHHANIDRLWNRWIALGGGRRNPVDDPAFMNTRYNFVDETGAFVSITGAEGLETVGQMGYRYDDDPVAPAGFATPPSFAVASVQPLRREAPVLESVPGASAAFASEESFFDVAETALAEGSGLRLGGSAAGVTLAPASAPQPLRSFAPAPGQDTDLFEALESVPSPSGGAEAFVTESADSEAQPVLLQLEDIDFDIPPGVWYAIYINKPASTPGDPRGPYFAGIFAPFAQNTTDEPTTFDITGLLNRQVATGLFDGGQIGVDFVPSRDVPGVPEMSIGRVRIVRP